MSTDIGVGFDQDRWSRLALGSPLHDPEWIAIMMSRLPGKPYTVTVGDELGFVGVLVDDPEAYEAYNPYAILWRDPPVFDLTNPDGRRDKLAELGHLPEWTLPALALVVPGYLGDPAGKAATDVAVIGDCLNDVTRWARDKGLRGVHVLYTEGEAVGEAVAKLGGSTYPTTSRTVIPVWWADWDGYLLGLQPKRRREIERQARRIAEAGLELRRIDPVEFTDDILAGRAALLTRYGQTVDPVAERTRLTRLIQAFGDRLQCYGALIDGHAVASCVGLRHDRKLQILMSGATDRGHELPFAHFAGTFYAPIQDADRAGLDEIDYGIGHSAGKILRGGKPRTLSCHAIGTDPVAARRLAAAARLLTSHAC
nr:GNAT family N-acetyltransferase [Kibdelosporangium sp. MJ126-NF4]CEL18018.1 hypothetical protein [Kibdelosporangium sp. MJ126-NF4]CTQ90754.1 hypothetical protein [Kibdelosporangium sp. MJ126-NF4]